MKKVLLIAVAIIIGILVIGFMLDSDSAKNSFHEGMEAAQQQVPTQEAE